MTSGRPRKGQKITVQFTLRESQKRFGGRRFVPGLKQEVMTGMSKRSLVSNF